MLEIKNRRQLRKVLEDKNIRIMKKNYNSETYGVGNEYVEAEHLREMLISQIKGVCISYFKDGKQFLTYGYTYYYLEDKTEIPVIIENEIPENVTWN